MLMKIIFLMKGIEGKTSEQLTSLLDSPRRLKSQWLFQTKKKIRFNQV